MTDPARSSLDRRLVAEAVGTAFLLATVVGSRIMGERLAGGNVAVALLANTLATGAGLVALILTFGPISGAHFNPAVTLADAAQLLGGAAATSLFRWLVPALPRSAPDVVMPRAVTRREVPRRTP